MKKKLLIIMLAATMLLITACGSDSSTDDVTVSDKEEQSAADDSDDAGSAEPEEEQSEVGKRSNPVPLGQVATFSNNYFNDASEEIEATMSVSLSNVVKGEEVYNYLLEANQFNEAAPDGYEWVMFDVSLKVDKGSADDAYYVMPSFKFISSSGSEIDQQDMYATFADGQGFGYVDLYEGGECAGKVAGIVPAGEEVLIEFSDWNASVFFALQ